jgi:hypothetical protein
MAVFTLTPLSSLSGSITEGGSIEFTIVEGGFTGVGGAAIASELDIVPLIPGLDASNVQQAIENLFGVKFTQSVPSTDWVFNHTLNRVPKIQVTDLAGNNLIVETEASLTQAKVKTMAPSTGVVYLS